MLKVEGIAFRFMPDPVQIKNALEVGVCVNPIMFISFVKNSMHVFVTCMYLQDHLLISAKVVIDVLLKVIHGIQIL